MNIHLCTNVIEKYFLLIIPNIKYLDIVIIHMSDYQVTMYSDNFKDFFKIQQQKKGFSMMMVIYSKVSCL